MAEATEVGQPLIPQDPREKDQGNEPQDKLSLPENVCGYFVDEVLKWDLGYLDLHSLWKWIDNPLKAWDGLLPWALLISLYFLKMKFLAFIVYIVLNNIDENPELVSFQAFFDANGYVFLTIFAVYCFSGLKDWDLECFLVSTAKEGEEGIVTRKHICWISEAAMFLSLLLGGLSVHHVVRGH